MDSSNQIIMPHNHFDTIPEVKSFVKQKGKDYLKFLNKY